MFVRTHSQIMEQLGIFLGQAGDNFIVGTRNQDFSRFCKTHDALTDINTVTNDVFSIIDIIDHFDGAQIDAESDQHRIVGELIHSAQYGVAKVHRDKKGIFRISQKTDGRSVTGVEYDPVLTATFLIASVVYRLSCSLSRICPSTDFVE